MASSFDFLEKEFPALAKMGKLAENYCEDDPNSSLYKIRKIGESITTLVYQYDNISIPLGKTINDISQVSRINTLQDLGIFSSLLAKSFTRLRKIGNEAVHEDLDSSLIAKELLPIAYSVCCWFYKTYGNDEDIEFKSYVLPTKTISENQPKKKIIIKIKKPIEFTPKQQEEEKEENQLLDSASQVAISAPKVKLSVRKNRSYKANRSRPLTEAETRELIDEQLAKVGWEVDSKKLNFKENGTLPQKGHNMAIAEWQTDSDVYKNGYADYALFIGEKLFAVIEAKAEHKDIPGVIDGQCKEYSRLIKKSDEKYTLGKFGLNEEYKVPFAFATNGRPYLKQLETKSGIWFIDFRKPTQAPKALQGWMSPIGLQKLFEKDEKKEKEIQEQFEKLNDDDFLKNKDGLNLRYYQIEAIHKVDEALSKNQKNILLAMATGTGKTRTFLAMIYRFLKSGRFKRILLLVDRNSLGKQAFDVFGEVKLDQLQTLNQIYNIKNLEEKIIDKETKLQISTVQGMVQRILYNENDKMPSISDFDLVIIDEAHRGYILDKEMADEELTFRDQLDYQSKYRSVIEYFDAVKIAFTATPALQTTKIFGEPVYNYSFTKAVYDGYLCDFDVPYIISTDKSRNGIHFAPGEIVDKFDPNTNSVVTNTAVLPDEVEFDVEKFNRDIITDPYNEAVLNELFNNYITIDAPETCGKTLIFAINDDHADRIVSIIKKICEEKNIPENYVKKITGSSEGGNQDKIEELIKSYKNENYPSVVVTVDLLTTGVDVPSITNLVFLRCVKSRILFEQMLGRATRKCPAISKTHFNIFDAARVYDNLKSTIDMKPVVQNPSVKMTEIIDSMKEDENAPSNVVLYQINQIIAKLQRKKNILTDEAINDFKILTKEESIDSFIQKIQELPVKEAKKEIIKNEKVFEMIQDEKAEKKKLIIDSKPDSNVIVTRGYGKNNLSKPEDYIEEFSNFIKNNQDKIEALNIVCTKPSSLTRESLKNLCVQLANEGYDLTSLNTAWKNKTNAELAFDIISVIRTCAIGVPIISHEERIKKAVQKLKSNHNFSLVEENWLKMIESNLLQENVLEKSIFDRVVIFRNKGGFKRINKDFNDKLEEIIDELNVYLYEVA